VKAATRWHASIRWPQTKQCAFSMTMRQQYDGDIRTMRAAVYTTINKSKSAQAPRTRGITEMPNQKKNEL
jgi:hypothetical protein